MSVSPVCLSVPEARVRCSLLMKYHRILAKTCGILTAKIVKNFIEIFSLMGEVKSKWGIKYSVTLRLVSISSISCLSRYVLSMILFSIAFRCYMLTDAFPASA